MVPKRITSLQHSLVKHWTRLRLERTYREETQRVLITGEKMVRELPLKVLISLNPISDVKAEETYLVTEPILKKITGMENPDGFAGEVLLPPPKNFLTGEFLVILDQISDPGNLGTIFRTALALKWDGVILTPGTVDPFNDKALRAAKGATFHLPLARMTTEEIALMKRHFYLADINGDPVQTIKVKHPLALILSNESKGASSWSKKLAKQISIPMDNLVESLNVAISGAILLYTLRSS